MCKGQIILLIPVAIFWVYWTYKAYRAKKDYVLCDYEEDRGWFYRNIFAVTDAWFGFWILVHFVIFVVFPAMIAIIEGVRFLWTWC
jgi:hypothetical protein